jgi:hydrogenase nickel incorporation protein HypA/HybF
MHEYSVLQALLEGVEQNIQGHPGAAVRRVHVRVGDASGVDAGLLATAFEVLSERGVCAGAELLLTRVPERWGCPRCKATIEAGTMLRCRACEIPAQLTQGDEIMLDRIELEVADV